MSGSPAAALRTSEDPPLHKRSEKKERARYIVPLRDDVFAKPCSGHPADVIRERVRYCEGEGGAMMRYAKIMGCALSILGVCALAQRVSSQVSSQVSSHAAGQEPARGKRIVIAASTVLDGKGGVLHDTRIVVEGAKIAAIETRAEPGAGPANYDLRGLTVMPGWIDAHAHITWNFGKDGKNAGMGGTTQEDAYQSASNAWVTLMAGFTT